MLTFFLLYKKLKNKKITKKIEIPKQVHLGQSQEPLFPSLGLICFSFIFYLAKIEGLNNICGLFTWKPCQPVKEKTSRLTQGGLVISLIKFI